MHRFTIRDIEHLSGIKAHTLRIWEQRYNVFRAQRKESQHRFYDNDDLKKLLQIAFLYHGGWKISKIAALSDSAILEAVATFPAETTQHDQYIISMLQAVASFDEPSFAMLLNLLIERYGMESCITEVCYPFLQRVGLLWMTGNIIPAQEHFASYLVQHKIIAETDRLPILTRTTPCILLFTPTGEHHELPLLFIHYLLRKNGWPTLYLGPNRKINDLPQMLTSRATHLFFHLITNLTGFSADEYLEDICKAYRDKTIVATGSGIQHAQRNFVNLKLLRSDEAIRQFMKQLT